MKRIVVQTVYYNCDDAWIEDYVENLCHHNEFLKEMKSDLLAGEKVGFRSEDPTSKAYGVTEYQIQDQSESREASPRSGTKDDET